MGKRKPRRAFILHSLKLPDEIFSLRRLYGPSFYVVGVHASKEERIKHLVTKKGIDDKQAEKLVVRDQEEEGVKFQGS